ncbi:MAG TPA: RNA polymerase sigma factor [Bacteroidetes bacterium]|nr:RNA polymerase sigma factor [Bacteroidota bacterium]HEX05513.1 RNA polymerase sigma factor [Bacteroidota bacterium]
MDNKITDTVAEDLNADQVQEAERLAEAELIKAALSGDREARTTIVLNHRDNVYNLSLKLTGNKQEAESILQETFLTVFEKLGRFRGNSKLGTWIHRIATNAALMRMRSRKGKHFVQIADDVSESEDEAGIFGKILPSLEMNPEQLILNDELKNKLNEAIASLPLNLRTVFVLKDLEGLSMAEIADDVGKTVSAVKADLHRARVKLRAILCEFSERCKDGSAR